MLNFRIPVMVFLFPTLMVEGLTGKTDPEPILELLMTADL